MATALLLRSSIVLRRPLLRSFSLHANHPPSSSSSLLPPFPASSYRSLVAPTRRCRSHVVDGCTRRGFNVRATQVSGPGSIDSPMMKAMETKIKEQLNADEVIVRDAYGDGRHVSIDVVSAAFEGQSAVNRQRMVYKAIWEELQTTVHAVDQMTTKTPEEAAATSG
ncbi:protein BOLA4, chloroplastic/mitochondrial [Nymphaea colorata]|nr:protein BOLA4, chloroplastic/mitochondrial [Nymphaea colorata]